MSFWTQSEKNIFVAAHRGWCAEYPENTMPAFIAATELGVDQIELDIRATKDGELVIIHDSTVDRTTDGTGNVCEMTFAEIRALDAGIKKGEKFRSTRIPTFREFLDYIKDHPTMTFDFELKVYPTAGNEETAHAINDRILRMIDDYGLTERCVINTWSGKLHEYILGKYGDKYKLHLYYPRYYMGEHETDLYKHGYCVCMFGENNYIATPKEFANMRESYGIRTWAGAGVNNEECVDAAIACGAELITCNNPDEILRILREKGYHK